MKRIAAIFMMLLMIMNICACKRMPEDTEGVSLPAASDTDKTAENNNGDSSEALEKTTSDAEKDEEAQTDKKHEEDSAENTEDKASADTPNTDDQPNINNTEPEEENPQPEKDIPQTNVKGGPDTWVTITEEKAPPCNATIDMDFSEDEVLVVIMYEQSAARQEYTAEDFPGVDIKEIQVVFDYHPDTIDVKNVEMILALKLNKEDKQSVLDAIKILEQNPIVYAAEPNYLFRVTYP